MKTPIFVGPTLWGDPVRRDAQFDWLPPAAEGDLYRIALNKPFAIGLIDGRFETVPSVWHKEILWALTKGIHVYGAASMGALRAVELASFGMVGVGSVYDDFRRGVFHDDDEVALIHAPRELEYRPMSEAMVDIRATLVSATASCVISKKTAAALTSMAKETFFKERTWDGLLRRARRRHLPKRQIASLASWLPDNRVEQKRRDALLMIQTLRRLLTVRRQAFRPTFVFEKTVHWQNLIARQRY